MGYRTYYTVETIDGEDLSEEICMFLEGSLDGVEDYCGNNETSWFDHEDDLKRFSLLPENKGKVIVCHGMGENNGDLWNLYVRDGKSQLCTAEIVYPPFDETKLK